MFTPVSDVSLHKSAALYHYSGGVNGNRKVGTGARGTGSMTGTVKALPVMAWDVTAIYNAPSDLDTPDTVVSCARPSPLVSVVAKIGALDMTKVTLSDFSLDLGNTVELIDDMQAADGVASVQITGAAPTLTVKISQPKLSDYNPFSDLSSETARDCYIQYGTATGKRMMVGVGSAQLSQVGESEDKGLKYYDLTFSANKACGGIAARKHFIFVY
jgi:hypothetical protein